MKIEDNFSFQNNDVIVVGCSSGPDSMALVDMLLKVRDKYQLCLVIAHVNHNVRRESVKEAKFLEDWCMEHDVLFEIFYESKYVLFLNSISKLLQ
mgnify:CR=1 FL=1